ncbi:NlpC/P60 family protein [Alicyclobacillus mengziensis]|uniref:C40 family peptidase n=1 Tax=Alicyclobacillus mengziensis TaxID=2931921 RepID=A0A9X7W0E3_9BACL|nr:NlpC/P60 family protein [Alicyclobacillus mengziensis]QSO48324.1 C40 family peptidase [Alicyclobacillus mengziensis]
MTQRNSVGTPVALSNIREGNLLFFKTANNPTGGGHVGIYMGNGMVIQEGGGWGKVNPGITARSSVPHPSTKSTKSKSPNCRKLVRGFFMRSFCNRQPSPLEANAICYSESI